MSVHQIIILWSFQLIFLHIGIQTSQASWLGLYNYMKELARKHNSFDEVRVRMRRYIFVWALLGQHGCELQRAQTQTQVPTWISWLELSKVKAVWSISRASLAFSIQIIKGDRWRQNWGGGDRIPTFSALSPASTCPPPSRSRAVDLPPRGHHHF